MFGWRSDARHVDLALEDLARRGIDERLRQQDLERDVPRRPRAAAPGRRRPCRPGRAGADLVALDLRRSGPRGRAAPGGRRHGRRRSGREADALRRGSAGRTGTCPPPTRSRSGRRAEWRRRTRSRPPAPRWRRGTRCGRPGCGRRSAGRCPPVRSGGASSGDSWRAPAPVADAVHVRAVQAAQVAQPRRRGGSPRAGSGGARPWCRTRPSSAWQSGDRPKRNVSWASKSNERPLSGPAVTRKVTLPGMKVCGL